MTAATLALAASLGAGVGACAEAKGTEAGPAPPPVTPTLDWLRDVIVKRGVPPGFVRTREPGDGAAEKGLPRLVFWTRTRRVTQTVVVAIVGDPGDEGSESYVRIQSSGLAAAPDGHPRLAEVLSYLLDRSFVMTGAAFARDASDGEIALRAEIPVGEGLTEREFNRALDVLLRQADEEAPRLKVMLEEASGPRDGRG